MNDDELLSRYLDGELAAAAARELEQRLASDDALQDRLDALRSADAATRRLYAAVDAAPMPASVLQMLAAATPTPATAARSNVVALPVRGLQQFWQMPVAIAASVALAVGFMVSRLAEQAAEQGTAFEMLTARSVDHDSALFDLLEGQASGQQARLGDAASGQALLTFSDQAGRYCRQLRLNSPTASAHAVACRTQNAWQIEAVAYAEAVPEGQFQAAAGATPPAIGATVDALIGTADPLDADQESLIISNGWENQE